MGSPTAQVRFDAGLSITGVGRVGRTDGDGDRGRSPTPTVQDPSHVFRVLEVRGVDLDGYRALQTDSPAVPNALAAILLCLRNLSGSRPHYYPHYYFEWSEGHPLAYLVRDLLFGEGDTAPVTQEVLREVEDDPRLWSAIDVGG